MGLVRYRTDTWNIQLSNDLSFQMATYPRICNMTTALSMIDYSNDSIVKLD